MSHATQLSEVDGHAGRLTIRGYDIHQLVGQVSFEEAAYLLWHGDLPNRRQLADLQRDMAAARHLPGPIMNVLRGAARGADGMHALRMLTPALSQREKERDFTVHQIWLPMWDAFFLSWTSIQPLPLLDLMQLYLLGCLKLRKQRAPSGTRRKTWRD